MEHFADRLADRVRACGSPACIGFDPVLERLPAALRPSSPSAAALATAYEQFGVGVFDAVRDLAPIVKINIAFFEVLGSVGVAAYERLVVAAQRRNLLVIGDVKRADIGSTSAAYARGHLAPPVYEPDESTSSAYARPDAITIGGYFGTTSVKGFVEAAAANGRGVYVLVRPSEPSADVIHEFDGRAGTTAPDTAGDNPQRLYEHLAQLVSEWGSGPGLVGQGGLSCVGAVVAAKDAPSTAALRKMIPQAPLLVPGFGAQGAGVEDVRLCFGAAPGSAIVNASRSVIYAFQQESAQAEFGADWQSAVRRAAQKFADELKPLVSAG